MQCKARDKLQLPKTHSTVGRGGGTQTIQPGRFRAVCAGTKESVHFPGSAPSSLGS